MRHRVLAVAAIIIVAAAITATTAEVTAADHETFQSPGAATAWFHQWGDGPSPFADPAREIVVALVDTNSSGEACWARRFPAQQA